MAEENKDQAEEQVEDEVDLLCIQILRRLNQLKQRKAADVALKQLCDTTIAELMQKSQETKMRAYNRERAMQTYTDTIAETTVAMEKVIATADVVAKVLNDDVAQDDVDDIPEIPDAEKAFRPTEATDDGNAGAGQSAAKKKRKSKRKS